MRHWDDVVFENRNKSYGAYSLRRGYSKRVILGWGISVALFAFCLYMSDVTLPKAPTVPPFIREPFEVVFEAQPVIARPKHQGQQSQKVKKSNQGPIHVTTEPIETPVEPIQSYGSENGVENGTEAVGTPDGTGTAPVEITAQVVSGPVDIAEVMPKYIGGDEAMMKFIVKRTKYPSAAKRMGTQGTVFVRFVIMPDGTVSHVEVIRGISAECDREAVRVISSMPSWIAGSQNGSPVAVRMVLPIRFRLNE